MIKQTDDIEILKSFPAADLFTVRINALAAAYGFSYDFARFYVQSDEDGDLTAIISYLDNDATLAFLPEADFSELSFFFKTIGYSSLLCKEGFEFDAYYNDGVIMRSVKYFDVAPGMGVFDEYPKLMDLFNFIDYDKQDFESWYVDLSHRIRHGTAKAVALTVEGEIVSSGIFSSITDDGAVLTSVNTKAAFRHMGYGSALVKKMTADIGRTVFLMREKDRNEEFYIKSGFINDGIWRMYK